MRGAQLRLRRWIAARRMVYRRVEENSFDDGNGFMKFPTLGDHLMPIEVRSDIRMGDPNVPQPRDLVRIQYRLTEIDLGGGKADGHFG